MMLTVGLLLLMLTLVLAGAAADAMRGLQLVQIAREQQRTSQAHGLQLTSQAHGLQLTCHRHGLRPTQAQVTGCGSPETRGLMPVHELRPVPEEKRVA